MPVVDGLRKGAVVETRRLAAEDRRSSRSISRQESGRVAVEELEAEGMQRRQERDVRILGKRIAQGERAIRREFGHQPVGDRLQALVFLRLPPGPRGC